MDPSSAADMALHSIFGRAGDFVGGIDNEALDFSQLEAFINSDGNQTNGNYFTESLNNTQPQPQQAPQTAPSAGGKLLDVIVKNKRPPGHSLPDSPPDSSSEHPYSPSDNCDANPLRPAASDTIYTALSQSSGRGPLYKESANLLDPMISDGIILGSHIVVSADHHHVNSGDLLTQDARILVGDDQLRTSGVTSSLLLSPSEYDKNLMHLGYSGNLDISHQSIVAPQTHDVCDANIEGIVYTNLQNVTTPANPKKKRKHSQDNMVVKNEPEHCSPGGMSSPANVNTTVDDDYAASESCLSDSQYQCIRFQPFQQHGWHVLCDQNLTELPSPHYKVDADKGFNFSNSDDAFVCQKKNHFQITCHVQLVGDAQFVKTSEGIQKISSFHLHFYGVKHDCPTQTIRVEQSQSDRSKKPFHPVLIELLNAQVTKVTVGRLHFSETTSNNMRKKGKPNPEQRYFQLVVGLHAHTAHGDYPIISHASQKIIVRASNPGQFESDVELCWQKGQTQDSIYHSGRIGVNTDRPDESLVIHGNLKITGHIIQPSDIRAKKNIVECNTSEQLRNVQKLRVVRYEYEPGFAAQLNRPGGFCDTGVIAQEVAAVIPEAVRPAGNLILENGVSIDDFLVVNKERIFMENVGAVKELCKLTGNLETRIDQLERINKRLAKYKRSDSLKSNGTVLSNCEEISIEYAKNQKQPQWLGTPSKLPKRMSYTDQVCSNRMIHIVIVILVLVMAMCLAAITTLYFLETARHNQLTQASLQAVQRTLTTLRPPKKLRTWHPVIDLSTTLFYKNIPANNFEYLKPNKILGKPIDCTDDEIDHEPCPIYCCLPSKFDKLDKLDSGELRGESSNGQNKTDVFINNIDKNNRELKALYNNNIDRARREKREDEWTDRDNGYDVIDDLHFTIAIQGKGFNATLDDHYLVSESTTYNYTYMVPMSKYMADDYVTILFQSTQAHLKDIENCFNSHKQQVCPWNGINFEDSRLLKKINENAPSQPINSHSVNFDIDVNGVQSKVMTYRASLKQNQNKCKLAPTKLGIEFTEYNFIFYRHCDEN